MALWSIWMVASLILAGLGFRLVFKIKRGGPQSLFRAALTDDLHSIAQSCSNELDGLYHQQTEVNEHKLESCLVEFFPALRARRRLRFRRLWMKTGLELI